MGYTHYWYVDPDALDVVRARMPAIVEDFKKLLPHLPPLAGITGDGEPRLEPEEVAFNGRREADEDYEGFSFPPPDDPRLLAEPPGHPGREFLFDFCKTAHRPYDLAVTAFLVLAKWHLGDALLVSSDGDLHNWAGAASLVEGHLGYPVDLYWTLEQELFLVEDSQGRQFLCSWPARKTTEELPQLEGEVNKHLSGFDRSSVAKEFYGWGFRGPYKLLEAPVRLPWEELPALSLGLGCYAHKRRQSAVDGKRP